MGAADKVISNIDAIIEYVKQLEAELIRLRKENEELRNELK